MRAVLVHEFGPVDDARLEETPGPVAGAGELLIEVHATAANFVDLLVIGGKYQFKPKLPFIPGKGPTGVVLAMGEGVTGFKIGDRVLAMAEYGGYAQQVAVAANQCYRIPDTMSFVDAASMSLSYDTAWFALRERGRLSQGDVVLVLGATGAVGFAALQLAKAMGAKVLAGVSSVEKADYLLDQGADALIDLSAPDLKEDLRAQVYAANGGVGADVVIDMLGGHIFDAALRALAWCGRMVIVGFATGTIPTIKANYLLVKNIEVSGLQVSDYRKRNPQRVADCYAEVFALYEQGQVRAAKAQTLPLAEFARGLRMIQDRSAKGRVVLIQEH